jgi:hypothetical protein
MSARKTAAIRLEPQDEYLHANTGEPNFNESMYFNFFDAGRRLGGFLRIGNRPNERTAETTVCLFQPDGRVVFNFKRPEIADNSRFEAGGVRFQVEAPFERLRIDYAGKASRRPLSRCATRAAAFQSNPSSRGDRARDPRRGADVRRRARARGPGRSRWSSRAGTTSSTTARSGGSRSTAWPPIRRLGLL